MAEQGGSFAGFSSGVPTTGQQGQGLAQVFTPQAIGLDTSTLERGAAAVGEAVEKKADRDAKKKALNAAAEAKKKAERAKRINDRKSGIYNVNQEALNKGFEAIDNSYRSGEITEDEYDQKINQFIKNAEAISAFETNVIKPEQAKYIDDENAFILTPSGEGGASADIKTYAEGTDWLSQGLDETAQGLINEDPSLGLYNAYLQEKHQNTRENFAKKDPDWSLGGALLSDDAFAQFVAQADEATKAKIGEFNSDYDRKQFVTQNEDIRDDYKEFIKTQRPDIMGKWVKQKKFDEGLSNQYVSNVLFNDDYKPLVAQAFSEAVDEIILPDAKSKTREDFVRSAKDDDDSGDDDKFKVSKTVVGKGDAERIASLKTQSYESLFRDLSSKEDFEDDEQRSQEFLRLSKMFKENLQNRLEKESDLTSYQIINPKRGEELKPITIDNKKGVVQEVFVNPQGRGFLILGEEKSKSTRNKATGVTTGSKVVEPTIIDLNDRILGKIETMYDVDLTSTTGVNSEEETVKGTVYKGLDEDGNPIFE